MLFRAKKAMEMYGRKGMGMCMCGMSCFMMQNKMCFSDHTGRMCP